MAMGELFNSPHEWTPLMSERLIDYIRIHISQAGGLTPCRKIAALGEFFGVKTAWHGPATFRPWATPATPRSTCRLQLRHPGILALQRAAPGGFQGLPVMKDGYLYRTTPRLGNRGGRKSRREVSVRARRMGPGGRNLNGGWGEIRRRDGTIIKQ